MNAVPNLFSIRPNCWTAYFLMAFIMTILIRFFTSICKALELKKTDWNVIGHIFKGFCRNRNSDNNDQFQNDLWLNSILGFIELISYPILLRSQNSIFIGAWLGFKTINRWNYAPDYKRGMFNRYLTANAIILLISYWMARNMF